MARDGRIAERTATKLAIEARQAAALAAAQIVDAADREAAASFGVNRPIRWEPRRPSVSKVMATARCLNYRSGLTGGGKRVRTVAPSLRASWSFMQECECE